MEPVSGDKGWSVGGRGFYGEEKEKEGQFQFVVRSSCIITAYYRERQNNVWCCGLGAGGRRQQRRM